MTPLVVIEPAPVPEPGTYSALAIDRPRTNEVLKGALPKPRSGIAPDEAARPSLSSPIRLSRPAPAQQQP